MSEFKPVNMKSPDGRDWVATSPTEFTNLKSKGYTVARAQSPARKAEQVIEKAQEPQKSS